MNKKYFFVILSAVIVIWFLYWLAKPYKKTPSWAIKNFTVQEIEDLAVMMYNAQGWFNDDEDSEIFILNKIKSKPNPREAFDELSNYYYFKYKRNLKADFINSLSTEELQPFTSFLV